jgi:PAS domain S-box-containing protein
MSIETLKEENEDLWQRLEEAEQTVRAIREGAVDAFVVDDPEGSRVYTLEGADHPYRILVEQTQQGAAILNARGTVLYCNLSLANLLKVPHERLIGSCLHGFIATSEQASYHALLRDGLAWTSRGEINLQRSDGAPLPVYLTLSALSAGTGATVGILVTDLTAQKQYAQLITVNQALRESEARLREADKRRALLINELNHRVKNTLAVVQSLAHQTMRGSKSPEDMRSAFAARLAAFSKAHDLLSRNFWEGADFSEIVAEAISPYRDDSQSRFEVRGPHIRLRPTAVLTLSLALHELATNSAKYGALSDGAGGVELSWGFNEDIPKRFKLRWTERGGPPVETPQKRGFGSRLIEQGLAQDVSGEVRLDFAPEGVVCTIDAPLEEIQAEEQPA